MKISIISLLFLFNLLLSAQQPGTGEYNKFLLAQSFEQEGSLEKAQKLYEELYQNSPENVNYFNSLYRVYNQQKNFAASILILENRIKIFPDDINLIGQLGSTYYMEGNFEKAYQIWEEPLKRPDAGPIAFRVIANFAIERRAFDKAIEVLEGGKQKTSDLFMFSMDLANLYSLSMRYDKAAEEYCSIIEASPTQLSVVQSRILSYTNKPDALIQTIRVFEARGKQNNPAILSLLARLYTENNEYSKAFDIYSDLDKKMQSQGAELYNYAEYVFREGRFDIASSVYSTIVERYPSSRVVSSARLGYAKSLEALVKEEFSSTIDKWKSFSELIKLDAKVVQPAVNAFEEIVGTYKHSEVAIESYLRIAQIRFRLQGDYNSAKEILSLIISDYSTSKFMADACLDLAEINLAEGNIDQSAKLYEEVLTLRSTPIEKKNEANFYLAKIYSYLGRFNEASKKLSEILKNLKDNLANDALELSLLLNTAKNDSSNMLIFSEAELMAERNLFSGAREKYDLIAQDQKAFIFHSIVQLRSAQMDIALDEYENAISKLVSISEEKEHNIYADKALYLLGNIYEFALNQIPEAIQSYEKLLLSFPGSIYIDQARERIQFLRDKTS